MTRFIHCLALVAATAFPIASACAAAPDPSDPDSPVPALDIEPALAGYRTSPEEARAGWREVHREVLGGGDHAGHGSHGTDPNAVAPTAPEPDPHAGHRMDR